MVRGLNLNSWDNISNKNWQISKPNKNKWREAEELVAILAPSANSVCPAVPSDMIVGSLSAYCSSEHLFNDDLSLEIRHMEYFQMVFDLSQGRTNKSYLQ